MKFSGVVRRKVAQDAIALRREIHEDAAPVRGAGHTMDEAGLLAAIAEFNHAVMAQGESFGKVPDRDACAVGRTGNLEQKLMLLWGNAGCGSSFFAEVEESAESIAKFSQGADMRIR